jgi:exosome complex exonuclease RRP6
MQDYIVDPFTLRKEIRTRLKQILEDSKILKVFHASPNDLRMLQFEWGIFVHPLVDTQLVYEELFPGVKNIGFKDIVEWAQVLPPNHIIEKQYQHADWRIRPLPEEYLKYARGDTHHLYRVWDVMKKSIFNAINSYSQIDKMLESSKILSQRIYSYPHYQMDTDLKELRPRPEGTDLTLFTNLWDYRTQLAQQQDVSPAAIMNRTVLKNITDKKPKTLEALCEEIPDQRRIKHCDFIMFLKLVRDHENPIVTEPVMSDEDWEEQIKITIPNPIRAQNERSAAEEQDEGILVINAPNDNFVPITCDRCHTEGHKAKECWEKRNLSSKKHFYANNPEKKRLQNRKKRNKWHYNRKMKKLDEMKQ